MRSSSSRLALTSAALAVFAPIGVYLGVWLHRRVSDRTFFWFVYVFLFLLGLRLIGDGISAVFG